MPNTERNTEGEKHPERESWGEVLRSIVEFKPSRPTRIALNYAKLVLHVSALLQFIAFLMLRRDWAAIVYRRGMVVSGLAVLIHIYLYHGKPNNGIQAYISKLLMDENCHGLIGAVAFYFLPPMTSKLIPTPLIIFITR